MTHETTSLPMMLEEAFAMGWIVSFAYYPALSPNEPFTCYIDNVFPMYSVHSQKTKGIASWIELAMSNAMEAAYSITHTIDATKPIMPEPAPAVDLQAILNLKPKPISTGLVRRI